MGYVVSLSNRAERDLRDLFEYLDASNSGAARLWFNRLEKAIYSLERFPKRCPRAPEAATTGRSLRHLIHGRKPDVYRVLYEVDESARAVLILCIRHAAPEE